MDNGTRPKRKYQLKKRADEMAETRRRITVAAVELHGTVGPARTTLSAVAERAGVQRHTLYRHFPDEAALFGACSAHFLAANPLPDLESWRAIGDPRRAKLRRAIIAALDAFPDIDAARRMLAPHLAPTAGGVRRHRIIATGHALEWWSLAPEELLPPRETVVRAVRWVVGTVDELSEEEIQANISFLSHAGRALSQWRGREPAEVLQAAASHAASSM